MSEYRKQIDSSDELGRWYDAKYTEMGDGWNTPADECNRHLDDLGVLVDATQTLLDVGCGAGHFLVEAQKRVLAFGVEISRVGLELCQRRGVFANKVDIGSKAVSLSLYGVPAQFDYIVSLGSLEHIVELDQALVNIRGLLAPMGKFYFYCPNELWKHFDQPNERTMTDEEWIGLFAQHGLYVESTKRWNDNTAFIGGLPVVAARMGFAEKPTISKLPPHGTKLNIGSGQRRFDNAHGWINIDCTSRPPDQVPDLVCDVGREPLPYADNTIDCVVLHQVYEHFGLGEGHSVIREANRVLRAGGSMILTVPCVRALAQRRALGQIDDYIFAVNMMGAYQGEDGDRHKWCFWDLAALANDVKNAGCTWAKVKAFDWRQIDGADIAKDWYIIGLECVK